MKKQPALAFWIDKLTNSIENTISGDSFRTEVIRLSRVDVKHLTKKNGWKFSWKEEFDNPAKEVYKLTIVNNPSIIQGLVSLEVKVDHVYMSLLESAPFNLGRNKLYEGVPANLVAYACQVSFQRGFDGFVSFNAKTKLIEHYTKTLGAVWEGGTLMVIYTNMARKLVEQYFKN